MPGAGAGARWSLLPSRPHSPAKPQGTRKHQQVGGRRRAGRRAPRDPNSSVTSAVVSGHLRGCPRLQVRLGRWPPAPTCLGPISHQPRLGQGPLKTLRRNAPSWGPWNPGQASGQAGRVHSSQLSVGSGGSRVIEDMALPTLNLQAVLELSWAPHVHPEWAGGIGHTLQPSP